MIIIVAAAGSALGFYRIIFIGADFMGDTGSMFLGFVLGAVAVQGMLKSATTIALAVPILALGLPILDTSLTSSGALRTDSHFFRAQRASAPPVAGTGISQQASGDYTLFCQRLLWLKCSGIGRCELATGSHYSFLGRPRFDNGYRAVRQQF